MLRKLVILTTSLLLLTAVSSGQTAITSQDVSKAVWSSTVLNSIRPTDDVSPYIILDFGRRVSEQHPEVSADDLMDLVHKLGASAAVAEHISRDSNPYAAMDGLSRQIALLPKEKRDKYQAILREQGISLLKQYDSFVHSSALEVPPPLPTAIQRDQIVRQAQDILKQSWTTAQKELRFKSFVDTYIGGPVRASVGDTASTILATHGSEFDPQILMLLQTATSLNDVSQIKTLFQRENRIVIDLIRTRRQELPAYVTAGLSLATQGAQFRDAWQNVTGAINAQSALDSDKAIISRAQSGFYILSSFAGVFDKRLSESIDKVARGSMQIAEAVSGFSYALKVGNTFGSLGTLAMTGNLLGGAMTLSSLFSVGESVQTNDSAVMDQLKAIQVQISALRDEMRTRFDIVDAKLNAIMEGVNRNYEKLVELSEKIQRVQLSVDELRTQVNDLQAAVGKLELDLHILEQNLRVYLLENTAAILNRDYQLCLSARRFGQGFDAQCISKLHDCATRLTIERAFSFLISDPMSPELDDTLSSQLKKPWHANAAFLLALAPRFGGQPPPNSPLPNPALWASCADTFTQYSLDWSNEVQQLPQVALDEVLASGQQIQDAFAKLRTANDGSPNVLFFKNLVENYRSKAAEVTTAINTIEMKYARSAPPDILWRGLESVSAESLWRVLGRGGAEADAPLCKNESVRLRLPANMEAVLPREFMAMSLMKSGVFKICFSDPEFVDTTQGPQDFMALIGTKGWFWEKGRASTTLTVTFTEAEGDKKQWSVLRQVKTVQAVGIRWRDLMDGKYKAIPGAQSAADLLNSNWIEGDALALRPSLFQTPRASADTETKDLEEIRGWIHTQQVAFLDTLNQNISSTSKLLSALTRLSGAKALLQSYVNLTLSSIADDELTSLLTGKESLVDAEMVIATFGALRGSANPDYQAARQLLYKVLDSRVARLENALVTDLSNLALQHYRGSQSLVDRTLSRLLLLQTIQKK